MEDFDITLSLNSNQFDAHVHPHIEGETTIYDIVFEDYILSIYKDTLYTWTSDNSNGLNKADIQSIGEQLTF